MTVSHLEHCAPPLAFSVVLPMPPSLNNVYATVGKRRVKVQSYKDWREMCSWLIAGVPPRDFRIPGPISVQIELPAKMRGDLDNRIKPILDALVGSKRIDDDRNVAAIHATKTRDGGDVLVTVSAFDRQPSLQDSRAEGEHIKSQSPHGEGGMA